ncbi:MAG TPA: GAF domain-containing protein [bacterium]|nr:GAF domain-containing protein [bacterium]
MDKNEAKKPDTPVAENDEEKDRQKPDEILSYMSKSMDFIKDLMEDNERLRYREVQLQEENFELSAGTGKGQRAEILQQQLKKLEQEKDRLLFEYKRVEDENKGYAARYVDIEDENNNLANLYVCSFQLHSTLDFKEVVQIIMEIIINLIGGEDYGIFLLDGKTQTLRPVAMEGMPIESIPPVPVGKGVIGQAVMTGENYYHPDISGEQKGGNRTVDDPLVCIPLKIKDSVIGVITLYKLLPQKTLFANVDYELFTLLAGHAATAIFSSKLYSEAQRKLHTIKGFMELLTSSEK